VALWNVNELKHFFDRFEDHLKEVDTIIDRLMQELSEKCMQSKKKEQVVPAIAPQKRFVI